VVRRRRVTADTWHTPPVQWKGCEVCGTGEAVHRWWCPTLHSQLLVLSIVLAVMAHVWWLHNVLASVAIGVAIALVSVGLHVASRFRDASDDSAANLPKQDRSSS
jgi:hypothetical protein